MLLVILSLSFITMVCVLLIYTKYKYDELSKIIYKIGVSENDINSRLREEQDLINRCINIIERKTDIKENILLEIKNIKSEKFNNIDKDKLLNLGRNKIISILETNPELNKIKSFPDMIKDLTKIENELIALRTYYNFNVKVYNKYISTFKYKIIAKIKKYKMKSLYEGEIIKKESKI